MFSWSFRGGRLRCIVRLKECPDFGVSFFIECHPFFGSQRVISSLGFVVTLAADVSAFMPHEVRAAVEAFAVVAAILMPSVFVPVAGRVPLEPRRTNKSLVVNGSPLCVGVLW